MQALWQHQVGGRIHISDQEIDNFLLSEEGKHSIKTNIAPYTLECLLPMMSAKLPTKNAKMHWQSPIGSKSFATQSRYQYRYDISAW